MMRLDEGIEILKGVGPKKLPQLRALGLYSIFDLLTYFPRSYEDRSRITPIGALRAGETATVAGVITGLQERRAGRRGMVILTAMIADQTGAMTITWFNQKFLKQKLKTGRRVFATGKVSYAYGGQGQLDMSRISSCDILGEEGEPEAECGILPVYSASESITQKFLRSLTGQLFAAIEAGEARAMAQGQRAEKERLGKKVCQGDWHSMLSEQAATDALPAARQKAAQRECLVVPEVIPEPVRQAYGLMGRVEALKAIHYPESSAEVDRARYRLAFEELYLIQCGLLLVKKQTQEAQQGVCHGPNDSQVQAMLASLPFQLTGDQQKVWGEICRDMESTVPMRRLVQGDVGSGKTVVAMLALVKTVENGFQGAMMAPTEILARQHYGDFQKQLAPLGIRVELLSGRLTKKQRQDIYDRLQAGEIDILIGTHALIQEEVHFANLGLAVTDEQHRFGINQRALLEKKGEAMPDVLVMTATPIPRTLTLTVYGDLEVSMIKELPPGRKPVRTFVRGSDRRELIYKFVLEEIQKGRQAYVVCPLIERNDESSLTSAQEVYEELTHGIFWGIPCALVHGQLKQKEKEAVMQDFYEGKIKLLVATTVIEVGVNVPNASIMVVEHAQQFGLAQLHQLRGRIGRGEYASWCILVSEGRTETARQRMAIMESTSDGFVLAEEDLKLRGPGQFFGGMQHGLPDLKVADVEKDIDVLLQARRAALESVENSEYMKLVLPALQLQYRQQFLHITET